jgi:dTDP-4-amino-4,6-dideoxygalactose transaminase
MIIPFLDLKAINARHAVELKAVVARVIDSGWYVLGEEVKAFEAEFGAWVGSPYAIGTSDGLSALILALRGWKELGLLKEGDAVAVPANTYIASILAITENRLRPVLVEPDEDTFNLGAANLAAALTPDVKAVLAVHLYGQLADMSEIAKLCRDRGLLLLEDAAQAHGAQIGGVKAGAWGDAAAFSFYPGKNLGALGDAGAVTCKDAKLAELTAALEVAVKEVEGFKAQVAQHEATKVSASKEAAKIAASVGVSPVEISPSDAKPSAEAVDHLATFLSLPVGSKERNDYFAANKAAIIKAAI